MDDDYVRAVMTFFVRLWDRGLDLPRQPHRQLVPVPPDRDLRPRGRARRDGRHALHDPLPVRGRRRATDLDRDGAARDDPRRRRASPSTRTTRAIATRRPGGRRPVRRAARARDRRRARRPRVRHRRAQGHAGPRSDRLRDRPRPRPPELDGGRPGRPHERGGGRSRGARPRRRPASASSRGCEERGLLERREPYRHSVGTCERCHSRIEPLDLAAMVVRDGRARAAGDRGAPRAARPLPPGVAAPLRDRVARGGARLVHLAAALVGAPASRSGTAPTGTAPSRVAAPGGVCRVRLDASSSASRTCSTPGSRRRSGRSRRSAGRTRPRARALLPGRRQLDRARDHPPLGEPDDLRGARCCSARCRSPT